MAMHIESEIFILSIHLYHSGVLDECLVLPPWRFILIFLLSPGDIGEF